MDESPTYRNLTMPLNAPLISGLNVKDDGLSEWHRGRDGDLRDVWRQAVRGQGRLMTVLGTGDIVEHDLGMSLKGMESYWLTVPRRVNPEYHSCG